MFLFSGYLNKNQSKIKFHFRLSKKIQLYKKSNILKIILKIINTKHHKTCIPNIVSLLKEKEK
ncbi:hypothetical protein BpHYR1_004783 [Brachionus plicatilis]|uniref:Uncharacterized protein n=1 Tax=Brachionus plicatilis TaxID=10195 RepID=A0A3M7T900_BRAPC|nr:hypothetical protein BpHYR1_004783 [Brachionus plicatilis]